MFCTKNYFLGVTQYEQRVEDIRLLKLEIKRLRSEKNKYLKSPKTNLKFEVFQLERELQLERQKAIALKGELKNPVNIHRWRKLEGSDPQAFDMLRKIQVLQKYVQHYILCFFFIS